MEALLPRSVPQLHPQTLVLDVDRLGDEIHPHGGLTSGRRTCSFPVKLSKMNRFMIDVFPTDWSPSSTILHFTAGLFYIFQIYVFYGLSPHNPHPRPPTSTCPPAATLSTVLV